METIPITAETITQRVRRTLDDLAVIREALHAPDQKIEANPVLDLELAAELKTVVDAFRKLLWAYIQTLSARSGRHPEEVLDWYKMEIAVEMLRYLRRRTPSAESESFSAFERLVSSALAITSVHAGDQPM